jgi:hypothetical protein
MKLALILTFVVLAGVGCNKSVVQVPDPVSLSKNELTACLQQAGNSYALEQANLKIIEGRVSEQEYHLQDFESRQVFDAARALCEEQHTNRLLDELLNRRQQVR